MRASLRGHVALLLALAGWGMTASSPALPASTDSLRWRADRTPFPRRGSASIASERATTPSPSLHAAGDSAGAWNEVPPPRRRESFLLHDARADRLILAGNGPATSDGDLWELALGGEGAWSKLPAHGSPPPALSGAGSAYDAARRRLLVFSGSYDGGYPLDLVFSLSLDPSPTWGVLSLPLDGPRPGGRQDAAVAWDATRNRLLVFGGRGDRRTGGDESGVRNDTWSFDANGGGWTPLPIVGELPSERWGASALVTPDGSRLLLFGGYVRRAERSYEASAETWELSLDENPQWRLIAPAGEAPAPSSDHPAFWDSAYGGGSMIVVTGWSSPEIHAYDPVSTKWSAIGAGETMPTGFPGRSLARDPSRDRYFFYDRNPGASDARALDVLEIGSAAKWSRAGGTVLGPGRFGHATVVDARGDRMIVFGGVGASTSGGEVHYLADPWELSLADLRSWAPLTPGGEPPEPRHEPVGVFDGDRNRAVFFGGWTYPDNYLADVWELAFAGGPRWNRLLPSGPAPEGRRAHGAAYDPVRHRMIVFGGASKDSVLSDLWAFELVGEPRWTRLEPAGERPSPRYFPALTYDAAHDRILMHGGGFDSHSLGELWELALDEPRWRRLEVPGYPLALQRHGIAHDPVRGRLLVYGGEEMDYDVSWRTNAVYTLELDEPRGWNWLRTAGSPYRWMISPSWFFDPRRDRVVTFSGSADYSTSENAVLSLDFAGMPVASEAWLLWARPFADRVELAWESIEPGAVYDVERREAFADWRSIGVTSAGADGRLGHVDDHVRAGWRYAYRLFRQGSVAPGAGLLAGPGLGEVSVDVPGGTAVQFVGPRPNPARPGETTFWFSLASTEGAAMEIFDGRGRRLWSEDLSGRSPGPQVLRPQFDAPAGVYFARLRGAGGAEVRKFVLVR